MRESLKVAVLSPSAPPTKSGGVASAHYNLYKGMLAEGRSVELFTYNEEVVSTLCECSGRYGSPRWLRFVLDFGVRFYLKIRGAKGLTYQVSDIVKSVPGILQLNKRLKMSKADVLILPDRGAPALFLNRSKRPVILVAHHNPARFLVSSMIGDNSEIDINAAVLLEQKSLEKVSAVVCPSHYMKKSFEKTYRFSGPIEVIPNLIDVNFVNSIPVKDVRRMMGLEESAPLIYIPSAGSPIKGKRFVAEIIRRLTELCSKPVGFFLSGDLSSDMQEELRFLAKKAKIYAPGQLENTENISVVKGCTFGVSPTLLENFGMAILEALFCGVPMVTFAVGGNRELVADGQSGYLVPFLDVDSLIDHAAMLLDPCKAQKLRMTTKKVIAEKYDQKESINRYFDLCNKVLNNN